MKVVSVCSSDWANFSHNFSESLKAVGVESYSYCLAPHPFGYENQSTVVSVGDLKELTSDADFTIVHHSCAELLPYINYKKLIHYAAGTKYRQEHHTLNHLFKDATTFIALPEFQKLTNNFHYIVGAIDTQALSSPLGVRENGPVFGHFPSNPGVKGTSEITSLLAECGVNYVSSSDRVSHNEQIKRMRECDVYVELLSSHQGGKPYGSFGMTTLEAAAMGKIVITQSNNDEGLYNQTYGFCGLNFAKDRQKLKQHIQTLANYKGDYLLGQMKVTRDWVESNHSFRATGERALKILNGIQ